MSPKTNAATETSVKTVKRALRAAIIKEAEPQLEELSLFRFLLDYFNTAHFTTGVYPAHAMVGRQPRARLDLLWLRYPRESVL